MPLATSPTYEELVDSVPQDADPYLVAELWQAASCPSSDMGEGYLAAAPVLTATGEVCEPPTGFHRWTGEALPCHKGDLCTRDKCVFHHSWGQSLANPGMEDMWNEGDDAAGLHAMIAALEAGVAGHGWD